MCHGGSADQVPNDVLVTKIWRRRQYRKYGVVGNTANMASSVILQIWRRRQYREHGVAGNTRIWRRRQYRKYGVVGNTANMASSVIPQIWRRRQHREHGVVGNTANMASSAIGHLLPIGVVRLGKRFFFSDSTFRDQHFYCSRFGPTHFFFFIIDGAFPPRGTAIEHFAV